MNYLFLKKLKKKKTHTHSGSKETKQNKAKQNKKHVNVHRSKKTTLNFANLSQTLKCRHADSNYVVPAYITFPYKDGWLPLSQWKIPYGLKRKGKAL